MIEVKNLKKGFAGKSVLNDVSVQMKPGNCNLIIMSSASGKTVIMNWLVGLLTCDRGSIMYSGKNFTAMPIEEKKEVRKEIGMLFQGSALFSSMTVEENIIFPLDMFTRDTRKKKLDRVNEVLDRV